MADTYTNPAVTVRHIARHRRQYLLKTYNVRIDILDHPGHRLHPPAPIVLSGFVTVAGPFTDVEGKDAKDRGFAKPFIFNCSGYETVESLKMLDGLIDVYLPDFKYMEPELAEMYSHALDYP
ncbi:MAG: hypothetical protein IKU04_01725, partial [Bacteroidales bacterium]|nr:hypothetical protein [Bacteroidales bacterium]